MRPQDKKKYFIVQKWKFSRTWNHGAEGTEMKRSTNLWKCICVIFWNHLWSPAFRRSRFPRAGLRKSSRSPSLSSVWLGSSTKPSISCGCISRIRPWWTFSLATRSKLSSQLSLFATEIGKLIQVLTERKVGNEQCNNRVVSYVRY